MPDILSRKEVNLLVEAMGHQESPGPESAATIAWLAEQARLAAWGIRTEAGTSACDGCPAFNDCPDDQGHLLCETAAREILEWWEAGDE